MKPVKSVFKYLDKNEKQVLQGKKALLLVSIGKEAHEGERFLSTIDLVNKTFGSCIVSLYDTLQRHTMSLSSKRSLSELHKISRKEGDIWLARNDQYLKRLEIPHEVIRWDRWLNHNAFEEKIKLLKRQIDIDSDYSSAFEQAIELYLERYLKNLKPGSYFNEKKAYQICFDYLLEECAVLCIWPELNCEIDLYPGQHNLAFTETKKSFIKKTCPNLLNSVIIGFRNAGQLNPQKFTLIQDEIVSA